MIGVLWNAILIFLLMRQAHGKAMMVEPPHRSSLWRYHKTAPINTKDDLLNCGGYEVQWEQNSGMCGVCGQPFDGLYVDHNDYPIIRSYNQGSYVNVTVEVNSNLLGYFEFRLCPRNSSKEILTHDCFEQNMLWIEESWSTRYYVGSHGGIYDLHVRLPADTSCSHCVFQWKYSTGYRMGGINECRCMGCGRQETFYNCADVEIISDDFLNQKTYFSPGINIHNPLFLISGKNLSKNDIELFRETLPVYESPKIPEIRKGQTLSYLDKILFGQITRNRMDTGKRTGTNISRGLNIWHTNPYVVFKANVSFPLRLTQQSHITKQDQRRPNFWNKISIKPKPSTFWDAVIRNPKPTSSIQKPPKRKISKILVKPKIQTGARYIPPHFLYYPSVSSRDSVTFPLFTASPQIARSKNGECHPTSSNYRCRGKGQYSHTRGIDQWCMTNCRSNHCVKFMCDCGCDENTIPDTKCHAVGPYEDIYGMDEWCYRMCSQKSCPANVCSIKDCQNGS